MTLILTALILTTYFFIGSISKISRKFFDLKIIFCFFFFFLSMSYFCLVKEERDMGLMDCAILLNPLTLIANCAILLNPLTLIANIFPTHFLLLRLLDGNGQKRDQFLSRLDDVLFLLRHFISFTTFHFFYV